MSTKRPDRLSASRCDRASPNLSTLDLLLNSPPCFAAGESPRSTLALKCVARSGIPSFSFSSPKSELWGGGGAFPSGLQKTKSYRTCGGREFETKIDRERWSISFCETVREKERERDYLVVLVIFEPRGGGVDVGERLIVLPAGRAPRSSRAGEDELKGRRRVAAKLDGRRRSRRGRLHGHVRLGRARPAPGRGEHEPKGGVWPRLALAVSLPLLLLRGGRPPACLGTTPQGRTARR